MICYFCKHTEDNEVLYGKFYTMEDIMIHYFCLLLSSNIEQNGADDEGILGFLMNDIRKEQRRSQRYLCVYCHRGGATICCSTNKCKKVFHLPCGLKRGSLHQFFGQYKSYCSGHRPVQRVPAPVLKQLQTGDINCTICFEEVPPTLCRDNLWAPCCSKNTWFHRNCVQAFAMSSGYFFKCPQCNDKSHFEKAMLQYGIFIPEQDASWELEPHAYEELLHRHNRCDAPVCKCTKGREYSDAGTRWEIILCKFCGAQGIHKACGREKWNSSRWECQECINMLQKRDSPEQPANEQRAVPSNSDDNLSRASSSTAASPPPENPVRFEQHQEEEDDIIVIDDEDDKNLVPTTTGRIVEVRSSNAFFTMKNNSYDDEDDEDDIIVIDDSDGEDNDVRSRLNTPSLLSLLSRNSMPTQPTFARNTSVIQSVPNRVNYPNLSYPRMDSATPQSGPNRNSIASHSFPDRNNNAPTRHSVATPSVSSRSNTVAPSAPSSSRVVNPSVSTRSGASNQTVSNKNSDFVIGKDGAAIEVVRLSDIPLNGQPLQVEGDVNVTAQPSCGSMMFLYQQPVIVHTMPTATAFMPETVKEFIYSKKRKMQ
ncbi:G2/M phase-specific E3 ubiquitin-protein ligase [Anabrus simplex]|uniref:G2/M phase-specific E3 ubiquitin-protein ligase n=1 Tax=Anabrus simplex TaxID=316456 RepID=UPI0035A33DA2